VRILDEHTLLIPERPGNKIADTLRNVLETGRVALLFLVPGVGETFRVNGSAVLTDDADLLAGSAVEGKQPKLGILVTVEEAYTQCSKALVRSELWNPEKHVEQASMPTTGQMLKAVSDPTLDVEQYEAERRERYRKREGLY
jgi:hypothetical protein